MPALRVQMHLYRNPRLLQRNVVRQRVVYVVHVVIFRLQQERGRRLARDMQIRVQGKPAVCICWMGNHKLLDTLFSIPLRCGERQMPRVNSHRKIRTAALFVGRIYGRVQAVIKMIADRCR